MWKCTKKKCQPDVYLIIIFQHAKAVLCTPQKYYSFLMITVPSLLLAWAGTWLGAVALLSTNSCNRFALLLNKTGQKNLKRKKNAKNRNLGSQKVHIQHIIQTINNN